MTRRAPLVAGNWKMNTTIPEGVELARRIVDEATAAGVEVAILPPFTHLWAVAEVLRGSHVALGSQNVYWRESGAFTGEISPLMLAGLCDWVLVGHSERRHVFHETDDEIGRKLQAVLQHELGVMLAVGETEAERESDATRDVVVRQLERGLEGVSAGETRRIVVAYEPVWAIGTGKTATPEQAQEVCGLIREWLRGRFGDRGDAMRILYGGSVTESNADELFRQPDIDGGLIGGASLKADVFAAIVAAAEPVQSGA